MVILARASYYIVPKICDVALIILLQAAFTSTGKWNEKEISHSLSVFLLKNNLKQKGKLVKNIFL